MTRREKLARQLMSIYWGEDMSDNPTSLTVHALKLADWVIEDRKRIVEPLVNYREGKSMGITCDSTWAIDETLKKAGVSNA
jgi:hypothetical protein